MAKQCPSPLLTLTFSFPGADKSLCFDEGQIRILINPGLECLRVFSGLSKQHSFSGLLASFIQACLIFFLQ